MTITSYQVPHYLVIKPISEVPAAVEPYLESLSDITGVDRATLKQKFVGNGLDVLKVHYDQEALEGISQELKKVGLISAVIGKDELSGSKKPLRIAGLEISQKFVRFLSPNAEVLLSIDGTQKCLIVLGTMNFGGLQKKRMARLAMHVDSSLSLQEILKYIFLNSPIMDVYISNSDNPMRIDSRRFNYNCLGEVNKRSAALNFPVIIREIGRFSSSVILDTGFGEHELPFLNWAEKPDREILMREFTSYSHFVFLAYQKQLFTELPEKRPLPEIPILNEMIGIVWSGASSLLIKKSAQQEMNISDCKTVSSLPHPPEDAFTYRSNHIFPWLIGLQNFFWSYKRYMKTLGPSFLVYPLSILVLISFGLSYSVKRSEPIFLGLLPMGLIFFIYSFVLLKRKHTMENCPTSKIRSMPMGEVEIKGYVKQKYFLKAPHTLTDCVYYSYKVYEEVCAQDGSRYVLKDWGNSGNIPFYLEDDTGKVLIIPGEAIIHAGITQTMLGDPLTKIFGAKSTYSTRGKKVIETVIPVEYFLYVMGFARPLKISSLEKRKKFLDKLRSLKTDQGRLKKYDINHDGEISEDEWELARKDIEEEVLLESLSLKGDRDNVAIGEHPSGGLFYISDKREERLLNSMTWTIPLLFVVGLAAISGGIYYLLKLIQDKTLLLVLQRFF